MEKPSSIAKYREWVKRELRVDCDPRMETYYNAVTHKARDDFNQSPFWLALKAKDAEFDQEYLVSTGYPLYAMPPPSAGVLTKPFESFVEKTYRRNVLNNDAWPEAPPGGWFDPHNCFTRINDLLRTMYVVKYVDGVDFLFDKFSALAKSLSLPTRTDYEARDEGYYAGHFNVSMKFSIPAENWDVIPVDLQVEIQITTQLQEVISKLMHEHYEKRRIATGPPGKKWQWDYRSQDFSANYLGHVLHYIEGTILEVRDKQKDKEV